MALPIQRYLLFFAIYSYAASTSLVAAKTICLQGMFSAVIEVAEQSEARDLIKNISSDSFSVKAVLKGRFGGKLLLIERKLGWTDLRKDFSAEGADLVPDLRILPTVLGEKGAQFFGYKIVSDKLAIIPDPIEVQGAISVFNKGLPSNSPLKIIITPSSIDAVFASKQSYIYSFIKNGTVPASNRGRQFMHDLIAHAMEGFFVDNRIVWLMQKRSEIWFDFMASRKSDYGPDITRDLKKANDDVLEKIADQIDGLGQGIFISLSSRHRTLWREENNRLAKLGRATLSPKELMSLGIDESLARRKIIPIWAGSSGVPPTYEWHRLTLASEKPDEFFKKLLPPSIEFDFEKYLSEYKKSHPEVFEPLAYDPNKTIQEIETLARRAKGTQIKPSKMNANPLTFSFVQRMNRLRRLTEEDPYYGSSWEKIMQKVRKIKKITIY